MDGFKIKDGRGSYHVNLDDPQWFIPTDLPFGLGCCNCGSYHQVHYSETKECFGFMLKMEEDKEETKRLQEYILSHPEEYPDNLLQTIAALRAQLADYKQTFDLIHQAEIRGVEMFREAHPEYAEKLAHPSTDRLICWLLEQLAAYESRDETWRGKKEMLENDLAKAWERAERAERVWGIVGRMRERVLNRPPGVIIPMWVHDAIEEAEAVRGPEGEDERD